MVPTKTRIKQCPSIPRVLRRPIQAALPDSTLRRGINSNESLSATALVQSVLLIVVLSLDLMVPTSRRDIKGLSSLPLVSTLLGQLFPLAYAVVDAENKENWQWMVRLIRLVLEQSGRSKRTCKGLLISMPMDREEQYTYFND